MKSLMIALVMAMILFAYGYILSTAGHDHLSHSKNAQIETGSAHDHNNGHVH